MVPRTATIPPPAKLESVASHSQTPAWQSLVSTVKAQWFKPCGRADVGHQTLQRSDSFLGCPGTAACQDKKNEANLKCVDPWDL